MFTKRQRKYSVFDVNFRVLVGYQLNIPILVVMHLKPDLPDTFVISALSVKGRNFPFGTPSTIPLKSQTFNKY